MENFKSATSRVREFGDQLNGPLSQEVGQVCDMAEEMINGVYERELELRNLLNFVAMNVQLVLRANNQEEKERWIEKSKETLSVAKKRMKDMGMNNGNGQTDLCAIPKL
jgi:hypothetical protein